jgi:hypothetical protein
MSIASLSSVKLAYMAQTRRRYGAAYSPVPHKRVSTPRGAAAAVGLRLGSRAPHQSPCLAARRGASHG